ncbi:MAG: thioredoxin family protein [Actinomycetota bacterium]|nr:thioredoxin family protein [Actinomycetota bacterium]MDP2287022.1 thioredoxin family protein [Actinomycetota bacterium]
MRGLSLIVVVLLAATAFGLWRRQTDGRMKSVSSAVPVPVPVGDDDPEVDVTNASIAEHGGEQLTAAQLGADLGTEATLVQFSTAFCQPCRATRRILDEVATMVEGTVHIEIDAEAHLELVRLLDVRRTPTVLVLDSRGLITKRAVGLPRKADVIAALGQVIQS